METFPKGSRGSAREDNFDGLISVLHSTEPRKDVVS